MSCRRGSAGSKVASWLWRAPRRALGRARDLYVRSLTGCAGSFPSDAAYGYGYAPPLSRSASAASSYGDQDLRELVRAVSERRRVEKEAAPAVVPRSQSAAMGRIDEDTPFEFSPGAGAAAFGRSQSVAVAGRNRAVASLA